MTAFVHDVEYEKVMKPTIGRIVLYRVSEEHKRPAIITHVYTDTCVNLMVFYDPYFEWSTISPGGKTSVAMGPEVDQWQWPVRE